MEPCLALACPCQRADLLSLGTWALPIQPGDILGCSASAKDPGTAWTRPGRAPTSPPVPGELRASNHRGSGRSLYVLPCRQSGPRVGAIPTDPHPPILVQDRVLVTGQSHVWLRTGAGGQRGPGRRTRRQASPGIARATSGQAVWLLRFPGAAAPWHEPGGQAGAVGRQLEGEGEVLASPVRGWTRAWSYL